MKIHKIQVNCDNLNLLEDFIFRAGNSLNSFRYFKTRSLDIVKNHLITYLYLIDERPIVYGHLDNDGNKIWLGIAVIQEMIGKGLGKQMMTDLIKFARKCNISDIHLSVDRDNLSAIKLYSNFKFIKESENDRYFVMKLHLSYSEILI